MKKALCLLLSVLLCLLSVSSLGEQGEAVDKDSLEESGGNMSDAIGAGEYVCVDLAVTGSVLWRIQGGTILCEDISAGTTAASLPISELLVRAGTAEAGEEVFYTYIGLVSWGENVLLCVPRVGEEGCVIPLMEAGLENGEIVLRQVYDATEQLGSFFNAQAIWNEVDLLPAGGGLYVGALDRNFDFHQYLYLPADGTLKELGTTSLMTSRAAVPWETDLMLVGNDEGEEVNFEILRMGIPSGEKEPIDGFSTGSTEPPFNFAFNEAENTLYYTVGNAAYRYVLGSGTEPEPFAVIQEEPAPARLGAVVGDRYCVQTMTGSVCTADLHGTLSVTRIIVSDIMGDESVANAAGIFNVSHPDVFVSVRGGEEEENVLNAMLSGSSDVDLYVIGSNTDTYEALKARGYLADLSTEEALSSVAANMPPAMGTVILKDGKLCALPVYAENTCLMLNVPGFCEVGGLSPEELPTDWPGFLEMLRRFAEDGVLVDNDDWSLGETFLTPDMFRTEVFRWIMNDVWAWLQQDRSRLDRLPMVLTPLLHAFEAVDFGGLGFQETFYRDSDGFLSGDEGKALLTEMGNPEISVMDLNPGMAFWPLALTEQDNREVSQTLSLIIVNPNSAHIREAVSFLETAWGAVDPMIRMMLDTTLTEPIVNDTYNEDIAYFEMMIPEYQKRIAAAESEGEAEALSNELAEMLAFMEEYKQFGQWYVSEDSIATYRVIEPFVLPSAREFWSVDEEDDAVLQYLDGMIGAEMFVSQLQSAMRMRQLEMGY